MLNVSKAWRPLNNTKNWPFSKSCHGIPLKANCWPRCVFLSQCCTDSRWVWYTSWRVLHKMHVQLIFSPLLSLCDCWMQNLYELDSDSTGSRASNPVICNRNTKFETHNKFSYGSPLGQNSTGFICLKKGGCWLRKSHLFRYDLFPYIIMFFLAPMYLGMTPSTTYQKQTRAAHHCGSEMMFFITISYILAIFQNKIVLHSNVSFWKDVKIK